MRGLYTGFDIGSTAMSVNEAAEYFNVSRSTIYRRIRSGELTARKVNRRWIIEASMDWHPQIARRYAEADGRTPADFRWLEYPVSDVRLAHPAWDDLSVWVLRYFAEMPTDTPHINQYEQDESGNWIRLPEPRGSVLSSLRFSLIDLADGAELDTDGRDHDNGQVQGGLTEGAPLLWERLSHGASLQVRLDAMPLFFPYNDPETGSGNNHYSAVNDGYLNGETASSREHTLALTIDGVLLIDGQPRPEPPPPEPGPAPDFEFAKWCRETRQAIEAQFAHFTAEKAAAEMGLAPDFYAQVETGEVYADDWHRETIGRVLNAWSGATEESQREQAAYEAEQARLQAQAEAEERRMIAEAEAERKANEPYIQRHETTCKDEIENFIRGQWEDPNDKAGALRYILAYAPGDHGYADAARELAAEWGISL